MKRNNFVLIIVIAVVIAMVISASRMHRKTTGTTTLQGDGLGSVAPDFTLATLDGKKVKLSDYRGKAVLLNFWATWCGPCKVEIPWFMELEKQYAPQGLVVIGVAMDDDGKTAVAKFAQEMKIDYPVLLGNDAVADQYGGVEGLPTTFYIDRNGKIVKKVAGLVSHGEIEDGIKAALNGSAPAPVGTATAALH
ncbi:MAG TPA: TlpA disulfide reductase family protein [Terriglobales bacterium]|nr:TlpA disulfide reductase family protein [Terriglobales bacterium]